jgi:hypothetical protein
MTMHSPITGLHHSPFAWTQEKMLHELLMHICGFEAWIVASHTHLTTTRGCDFPELPEPVLFYLIPRLAEGRARHFSAELPVPKVKTAIVAVCGGGNDISSQRQCYWAKEPSQPLIVGVVIAEKGQPLDAIDLYGVDILHHLVGQVLPDPRLGERFRLIIGHREHLKALPLLGGILD